MRIDLHVHSNNSDGAFPPAEVARIAREAGLDAIALTDHDSMAGIGAAREAGEAVGLTVYDGCEISAVWQGGSVHVLGYFMDPSHPRLREELASILDDREWRAKGMIEKLNALGVPVTFEQVRGIAKGEAIVRPHVAQAMVDLGVIKSTVDAFTPDWILEGGRAYVEKKALTPEGAVELIGEAGGAAVLAHPVWHPKEPDEQERFLDMLIPRGLAGIEVDHPDHDPPTRARFRALAERKGLLGTGSSDYHGNDHGGKIGENTTDPEVFARLEEIARSRAGA
ncbi:MAG: PHP domain-containing protein [Actinomycetota bacterium]